MKRWIVLFSLAGLLRSADVSEPGRQQAIDILRQMVDTNTTEEHGTTALAEALQKRFLAAGFSPEDAVVIGPDALHKNLVVRYRGSGAKKPILLICHMDVVEARREDWTTNPFEMVEKDGYYYGRGTLDMKSGDADVIEAFLRFKKEGYQPNRDLILALTAGEETGSDNGVNFLVQNHRDLVDAGFVLNPDAGGVYLKDGKPVDVEFEATEKLYADYQLKATSPGGHSSLPTPDNTIYEVGDALERLQHSPFPFELNSVTRAYFEKMATIETGQTAADIRGILKTPPDRQAIARLSSDPRYNSTMRTTCVATRFNAGVANNALPQEAIAIVNCRILPGHSSREVQHDLMRIFADKHISVDYIDEATAKPVGEAPERKSFLPPPVNPEVMGALTHVAGDLWPDTPVVPEMETGASDSIYTVPAGMPSYGVSGLAVGENDFRAHGKDERISVKAFDDSVEFYYRFLKALTQ